MKYLLAIVLLAASAAVQADDTAAYYSRNGESLLLQKSACDLPGYPADAKKSLFVAYMRMEPGCYVVTSPNTVRVQLQSGAVRDMSREIFTKWDVK